MPVWSVFRWICLKGALSSSRELRAGAVGSFSSLAAFISIHPWLCFPPPPQAILTSRITFLGGWFGTSLSAFLFFVSARTPTCFHLDLLSNFWLGYVRRTKSPNRALANVSVPQEDRWSVGSDVIMCWVFAKCTALSSLSLCVCVIKPLY